MKKSGSKSSSKGIMNVLPMDKKLFVQRRRVIKALYSAKEILSMDLPRIEVRIAAFDKSNTAGICFLGKNSIAISERCSDWPEAKLTAVVWHELAHAYFNAKHDDNCPLMHPSYSDHPEEALIKALLRVKGSTRRTESDALKQDCSPLMDSVFAIKFTQSGVKGCPVCSQQHSRLPGGNKGPYERALLKQTISNALIPSQSSGTCRQSLFRRKPTSIYHLR